MMKVKELPKLAARFRRFLNSFIDDYIFCIFFTTSATYYRATLLFSHRVVNGIMESKVSVTRIINVFYCKHSRKLILEASNSSSSSSFSTITTTNTTAATSVENGGKNVKGIDIGGREGEKRYESAIQGENKTLTQISRESVHSKIGTI